MVRDEVLKMVNHALNTPDRWGYKEREDHFYNLYTYVESTTGEVFECTIKIVSVDPKKHRLSSKIRNWICAFLWMETDYWGTYYGEIAIELSNKNIGANHSNSYYHNNDLHKLIINREEWEVVLPLVKEFYTNKLQINVMKHFLRGIMLDV